MRLSLVQQNDEQLLRVRHSGAARGSAALRRSRGAVGCTTARSQRVTLPSGGGSDLLILLPAPSGPIRQFRPGGASVLQIADEPCGRLDASIDLVSIDLRTEP